MANNIQWSNVAAPEMSNKGILGAGTLFKSSLGDIAKSLEAESQRRKSIVSKDIENQLLNAKDDAELQAIQQQVASPDNPYRQYMDPLELTKGLQSRSQAIKDKAIKDLEYKVLKETTTNKANRIKKDIETGNIITDYKNNATISNAEQELALRPDKQYIEKVKTKTDRALTDIQSPGVVSNAQLEADLLAPKQKEARAISKSNEKTLGSRIRTKEAQTGLAELVATTGLNSFPETQRRALQELYNKDIDDAFKIAKDKAGKVNDGDERLIAESAIDTMTGMLKDPSNTAFLQLVKANGGPRAVAAAMASGINPKSGLLDFTEVNLSPSMQKLFTMIETYQNEKRLVNPNGGNIPTTTSIPFSATSNPISNIFRK